MSQNELNMLLLQTFCPYNGDPQESRITSINQFLIVHTGNCYGIIYGSLKCNFFLLQSHVHMTFQNNHLSRKFVIIVIKFYMYNNNDNNNNLYLPCRMDQLIQ